MLLFFFFKQKTAYEMRISDWSSDVCSSDLERTKAPEERHPSILAAPSMFAVATIVGETLRNIVMRHSDEGPAAESLFRASLIVGGQIKGAEPRLFLIYPEGNFIEAGEDNPFFQIDRKSTRLNSSH